MDERTLIILTLIVSLGSLGLGVIGTLANLAQTVIQWYLLREVGEGDGTHEDWWEPHDGWHRTKR